MSGTFDFGINLGSNLGCATFSLCRAFVALAPNPHPVIILSILTLMLCSCVSNHVGTPGRVSTTQFALRALSSRVVECSNENLAIFISKTQSFQLHLWPERCWDQSQAPRFSYAVDEKGNTALQTFPPWEGLVNRGHINKTRTNSSLT